MEENNLFCKECQMNYSNISSFKNHIRKHHPTKLEEILLPNMFMCEVCSEAFSSSRGLNIHKKGCFNESSENNHANPTKNKLDNESIECSDCELEFNDLVSFKQHMRDHRDNKIMKKRENTRKTTRVRRKRKKSPDVYVPIKQESNNSFDISLTNDDSPIRKSKRKRKPISYAHLIESSDSENETLASKYLRKHICNVCNNTFKNRNTLQKHQQTQHSKQIIRTFIKRIKCKACRTDYNDKSSMRKHYRKYHPYKWKKILEIKTSNSIFNCADCDNAFINMSGLRKHVRRHHLSNFRKLTRRITEKSFGKPKMITSSLICDVCSSKYSSLSALRKHIKEQHPFKLSELISILYKKKLEGIEKKIVCSECDMKYSSMSGLRKHTRKHHPNKLLELAPLLYTFKRNITKNVYLKREMRLSLEDLKEINKYRCNICESSYSNVSNLRKHLRKFHPDKLSEVAPLLKDYTSYKYPCELCPKKFNSLRSFKNHQRKCHPEIAQPIKRNCQSRSRINKCPLCKVETNDRRKLLNHFKDKHDIEVEMKQTDAVSTLEEFLKWKDEIEKNTNSRFIKEYHFSCITHDVVNYICHRSGFYNPKGKGLRHMKAQGSSKINGYCPAAIKLRKLKDNSVKVSFCGTHIGHTTDATHLNLTKAERQFIAEKIATNMSFNDILESVRNSASSESDLKRMNMLSKKDLYNIKSSFHLASPTAKNVKPLSENVSFEIWIEDMKRNGDCVMFHKPQGITLEEHPNLKSKDFVLMIMDRNQREKLKKFGGETICIDRSFETNNNNFELISMMVLTETGEGFPCAFLITNRLDQGIATLFFHYIKCNVGVVQPLTFMSDMVTFFHDAWISIMLDAQIKSTLSFCTWQIQEVWRKKLSLMKSKEKQESILEKLCETMKKNDIKLFKTMIESTALEMNNDKYSREFLNFLMTNYINNEELWPKKLGAYIELNSNSHLERMHKTLKHLFLNGKNAKHFGKALSDIMRFIKDKLFDRNILISRGKINNKMKIAVFRHKLSLHSKIDDIKPTEDGWEVPSDETSDVHTIRKILPSCRCEFICSECKCCIHIYLCTCPDSMIKWNMCKHVHLLCRYLINAEESVVGGPSSGSSNHQEICVEEKHDIVQQQQQQHATTNHQVVFIQQAPHVEYKQIDYIKQHPHQVEFIKQHQAVGYKQQSQQLENVQMQHIGIGNHDVGQVENTYIYCSNETNQREMDAILAEVNICNLETVQVAQVSEIPTTCTIQIPTSCTVVPQITHISTNCQSEYEDGVGNTKENLKMKFLKLLEDASSPSELEVVQKMLASITPTLEVIKEGNSDNQQVLFPL